MSRLTTFAMALTVLCACPSAVAAQTASDAGDGSAAFVRLCGNTRGSIPAALAAAQASAWTTMTPAQMGMDASPFRSLEIRRGAVGEESMFLLATESVDAETQMLATACAVLVYPAAAGQSVPDPTGAIASWVDVPAESTPGQPGLAVFVFSDGEARQAVDPTDDLAVSRLAEQGRLHGVAVIYDPRKVMMQYTVSTPQD